jgi:hypothetical protein
MTFHVEPRKVARAGQDIAGLLTHLLIVKTKFEMSDASEMRTLVSEPTPYLISVMKANVLVVG